jgi:hypothetical protein
MKRQESLLNGLIVKETFVFISRNLEHIEIVETKKLFGRWTIKEVTREVYLPQIKHIEKNRENLVVIADAYTELHEATRRLKKFDNIRRTIS